MGIGPGSLSSDMERFLLHWIKENRNVLESIQHIFDIWNAEWAIRLKRKILEYINEKYF